MHPNRTTTAAIVLIVLAVTAIGVALIFSGNEESPRANGNGGSAQRTYSQALYSVDIPARWAQALGDEPTGSQLESIWRNPAEPGTSILIAAMTPVPGGRPVRRAESTRAQAGKAPSFRELAFEPVPLAGRPAIRWVFDLSGHRRVEYFVNQCEVGITVRGSTSPASFDSLAKTFEEVASSVAVRC